MVEMTRRGALGLGSSLVAGAVLAACGGGSSGGGSSKSLTISEWGGIWDEALHGITPHMKRQTGISASYAVYTSASSLTLLQRSPGKFDLAYLIPSEAALGLSEKVLEPIDTSKVTAFSDIYPTLVDPLKVGGNFYGVPLSWGMSGILYRKDKIPIDITSWKDLWRPELKGQLALQSPPSSGGLIVMLAASMIFGNGLKDTEAGWAAMERLKPNIQYFYDISSDPIDKLVDGSLGATVTFADFGPSLKSKGVTTVIPAEGADSGPQLICVPKAIDPAHRDTAYKYINYMLSPPTEIDWCRVAEVAPANSKVTLPQAVQANILETSQVAKRIWDIDYLWFGQNTQEWTLRWQEIFA